MTKEEDLLHYVEFFTEFEAEDDFITLGIDFFLVSVFDHGMCEDEAANNQIMFYDLARSFKKLDEYRVGEKKFLDFYRKFSSGGVICNYPGPMRRFDKWNRELEKITRSSLRERHKFDMYFIAHEVRVLGGYDRTDQFLPFNKNKIQDIYHAVNEADFTF